MKSRILILCLCFFISSLQAQKLTASTDKQRILIGEQLTLKVEGEFTKGQALNWMTLDSLPHFEIMVSSKTDTVTDGNLVRLVQNFTLTSWDSGQWNIPPIRLNQARTAPLRVLVGYSDADPNQPYHDVKDIVDVKPPIESKWYWYLIGLALLLVLFLLFFPKSRKKEASEVFVPDEGIYKSTLRQLDELKKKEVSDAAACYTEMITIFRNYLLKRKNIQSLSKTTDDLAIQMEPLKLDREKYSELVQTLRLSDLVKFARFGPAAEESRRSIEKIKEGVTAIEHA
jgi:hypothetical protein